MDADRAKDVIGRRHVYLPAGEAGNNLLRRFRAERPGDLAGDGREELLQYLNAQAALTRFPELLQQRPRLILMG